VELKRGYKPNIPRHFQIRLILATFLFDFSDIFSFSMPKIFCQTIKTKNKESSLNHNVDKL
jgi:hypothetical protein